MTDLSYYSKSREATILVVDDNHVNLTLLAGLLKSYYKIKVANNGATALKIACSNSAPDLILLDVFMPEMDGYEVCKQLKANEKTKKIPVIFLTANTEINDEIKGLELGASDYITKPISAPILLARVKTNIKIKRMQDFLRDQREWLHSIIESAPDALIVLDKNGDVLLYNSKATEIFDYDEVELYSKNISQLVLSESGVGIRKDGSEFPVELGISQLPSLNDGGASICLSVRNITERKKMENETRMAKKFAEDANKMKSDFLANMSHELRTPLNAIIGYSEMLHEDAIELKLLHFESDLEKINRAGKHLLSLINEILDLSKIEAGKTEFNLENINLTELIEDVKTIIFPMMSKNNNKFIIENTLFSKSMHTDGIKLKQTLFNLLSNAAKFTSNGVITLNVKSYTLENEERIQFSISDTGIGLTSEQINKLFENFVQADTSTTRKYGGTGLGLAISKRLCQMMGGDISVTSIINEGSIFTIDLPVVVTKMIA